MTRIRKATNRDRENIREVHLRAFSGDERPIVSSLAVNLLSEKTCPETISLVAEIDGTVVGHIAFSPVTVANNEKWKGYILAPLGVKPEFQKRRIGAKLIVSGIKRVSEKGVNALFVYGDPTYYSKFGFKADAASRYAPPYELQFPFGWQAIALNEMGYAESTIKIRCVVSLRDPTLW